MAAGTKEIQRRIKSIKNTRKITRAMEMVSVAKMKKEVSRVLAIRPYAESAWNILTNLSKAFKKYEHGLLEAREVKNILVILVTSNRGLCGGFNSQVIKKTIEQVKNPHLMKVNRIGTEKIESSVSDDQIKFDFIAVGKKGFDYLNSRGYNVVAYFGDFNYLPSLDNVGSLAKMIINDYEEKKYDKVVLAFTDYVNTIKQIPKFRQILPISKGDIEKQIADIKDTHSFSKDNIETSETVESENNEKESDYKIEPKPKKVLKELLPRLVEMQLYHAILESNASKESARMLAMKNATEAANEMVSDLQYSYNQLRQSGITQEISEITSGRAALED